MFYILILINIYSLCYSWSCTITPKGGGRVEYGFWEYFDSKDT